MFPENCFNGQTSLLVLLRYLIRAHDRKLVRLVRDRAGGTIFLDEEHMRAEEDCESDGSPCSLRLRHRC
jgi:hypothetical protein